MLLEHGRQVTVLAETQGEAKIQPNAVTDDLGREAMTMVERNGVHPCSMPHELSTTKSDNSYGTPSTKTANTVRPWSSPPTRPRLEADDVHIWRVSLDLSSWSVKQLREMLTLDEAARADRFHFKADRRHFIVARACLRKLLGEYLDFDPAAIRFSYSEHGKPSLAAAMNEQGLNFNLAHSSRLALYALTLKRQIGIDLEHLRPEFTDHEIVRRYFSAREVEQLDQLPAALRHQAFLNCWTRKEAFIKAIGIGLSLPLDQFEVTLAPNEPATLLQTHWNQQEASRWSLTALDAGSGYVAAVAVEGHGWELRTWQLDERTMLQQAKSDNHDLFK